MYSAELTGGIWIDSDSGGDFDSSEIGVGRVGVSLARPGGDPVLTASGDPMVSVTDDDGSFTFTGLREGEYQYVIEAAAFRASGPLALVEIANFDEIGSFEADGSFVSDPIDVVAAPNAASEAPWLPIAVSTAPTLLALTGVESLRLALAGLVLLGAGGLLVMVGRGKSEES